ncbi:MULTISPECIES: spore coat protein U domain-containing protein [unclassified Psychrobacter]|uniref:spore coat protein U domain-containing protein n=1 Tax=unclassified Psychrobacter TaxID=196806 RepID=UPI001CE4136D|nr:spore coat protein U domain-containing protein [Psychrobacter sp. FME13]
MQFNKSLMTAALFAVGSLTAFSANAATATPKNFKVTLNVLATCNITAGNASDIDLGTVNDGSVKTGNNTIVVACSSGTPYNVGLTSSTNETDGTGTLTGPGTAIGYVLTQTAGADGTPWGDIVDTNTLAATGNGVTADNTHTVYATTTTSTDVVPGTYDDTVTVNVTY